MRIAAVIATVLLAAALAGCGGGGGNDETTAPLQDGVYQYELTEQYLLDNGISTAQAENESGSHKTTIWKNGSFMDSWRTAQGADRLVQRHVRVGRQPGHVPLEGGVLRRLGDEILGQRRHRQLGPTSRRWTRTRPTTTRT